MKKLLPLFGVLVGAVVWGSGCSSSTPPNPSTTLPANVSASTDPEIQAVLKDPSIPADRKAQIIKLIQADKAEKAATQRK